MSINTIVENSPRMQQKEIYKLKTKNVDLKKKNQMKVFLERNTSTYSFFVLAEQFGTGQKIFILCVRNNWFRKFSKIEFKK